MQKHEPEAIRFNRDCPACLGTRWLPMLDYLEWMNVCNQVDKNGDRLYPSGHPPITNMRYVPKTNIPCPVCTEITNRDTTTTSLRENYQQKLDKMTDDQRALTWIILFEYYNHHVCNKFKSKTESPNQFNTEQMFNVVINPIFPDYLYKILHDPPKVSLRSVNQHLRSLNSKMSIPDTPVQPDRYKEPVAPSLPIQDEVPF